MVTAGVQQLLRVELLFFVCGVCVCVCVCVFVCLCVCSYVEYCKMESPSDDIDDVLNKTSQRIGALLKGIQDDGASDTRVGNRLVAGKFVINNFNAIKLI